MGIFKSIKNMFREGASKADEALADPVRDGKWDIKDAKDQVRSFRETIRGIKVENKKLENQRAGQKSKVESLIKLRDSAIAKAKEIGEGNDGFDEAYADGMKLHEEVTKLQEELGFTEGEIAKNKASITNAETQIRKMEAKINSAESKHGRLAMGLKGQQTRKALAAAQSKYATDDSPFAALDNLEKAFEEATAEADVLEEEVSQQSENVLESMEDKYGDDKKADDFAAIFASK